MSKFPISRGFVSRGPCSQEATASPCLPAALPERGPGPRRAPRPELSLCGDGDGGRRGWDRHSHLALMSDSFFIES